MAGILEDRPESLSLLMSLDPQELASPEYREQSRVLRRLAELARGLRGSEYWQLLQEVLIVDGLEVAKAALESEAVSDKELRVRQGEAKAYTRAYNTLIELAKMRFEEKEDGKAGD